MLVTVLPLAVSWMCTTLCQPILVPCSLTILMSPKLDLRRDLVHVLTARTGHANRAHGHRVAGNADGFSDGDGVRHVSSSRARLPWPAPSLERSVQEVWWPQRDLPPGGPIPAVPLRGHRPPDLARPAGRSRRSISSAFAQP